MHDVETVGGKNASLGEMIGSLAKLGVQVPGGFATTAQAYRDFLKQGGLDARIRAELANLNVDDVTKLAATGARIRGWILATPFPPELEKAVLDELRKMSNGQEIAVAVRSSATAEDLPEASFAGQQETFLNVRGEAAVLKAMHEVFASLFNDRAISYRVHQNFDHNAVALSAGVQHMVRSDLGCERRHVYARYRLRLPRCCVHHRLLRPGRDRRAGRGEPRRVLRLQADLARRQTRHSAPQPRWQSHQDDLRAGGLGGARGHGRGAARPSARASRSPMTDIVALARQALIIEEHYKKPMDIEWGKDGSTGKIYILQARPETVQSRAGRTIQRFSLKSSRSRVLASGRSIGQRIGSGPARVIRDVQRDGSRAGRRRARS